MKPYESLTPEERLTISQYIKWYAFSNENASLLQDPVSLSTILTPWSENKEFLFSRFNEKLILEKEIEVPIPKSEFITECYASLLAYSNPFYEAYTRLRLNANILNTQALYTNKVSLEKDFILPDGKKIRNGEKLMRALSKIAKAYNLSNFEEFRLQHSRLLNKKSLIGTYCLSIHPIDYMTMSDSNYSWTSCMSWQDIGDYRQGTVEMMNSPCVVVGYLKGDRNNEGYNSKRWRSLFIASPQVIINIKGYPYQDDELATFGVNWLSSLLGFTTEPTIYEGNKGFFTNGHMYNDFCDYTVKRFINATEDFTDITFNGPSECMCCGKTDPYLEEFDLYCNDCEEKFYCEECGERIIHSLYRDDNGFYYHEDCYNESFCEDAVTEEEIRINDAIAIYFAPSLADFSKIKEVCNNKNCSLYGYLSNLPQIYTLKENLSSFSSLTTLCSGEYLTDEEEYFDWTITNKQIIQKLEDYGWYNKDIIINLKEALNID